MATTLILADCQPFFRSHTIMNERFLQMTWNLVYKVIVKINVKREFVDEVDTLNRSEMAVVYNMSWSH